MQWKNHSQEVPEGTHAFLGASKYSWLNYDEEILCERYINSYATTIGTVVHDLAYELIKNNIKLAKTDKKILLLKLLDFGIPRSIINLDFLFDNLLHHVNDAITLKMQPEQILYYSSLCYGTADAISYDENNKMLRIHDLKTGTSPASLKQLEIYASLFCLEYHVNPEDISIELRIYQNNEILIGNPPGEIISTIMNKIIEFDKILRNLRIR